ncbi:MAG: D-glycero-alpha-D-manno-heptose-1,7-bisphosphate 7-phosphatase [Vicinamibacterales bacterium]
MSRAAVFLDRDGTLVEERGYIDRLDLLELFPWTADALRLLSREGFLTVVVTNQAAIGRGLIDEAFLDTVHHTLDERLARGRARVDRYYHCPHHPEAALAAFRTVCRCRKPGPGMIEQACRDLDIDPARSVMVGDRWIDVAAGQAAGTRTVLVRTGHGGHEAEHPPEGLRADAILNNLMEAVAWILRTSVR